MLAPLCTTAAGHEDRDRGVGFAGLGSPGPSSRTRADIPDAVEDLRKREGTTRGNIGFCIPATGEHSRAEFPHQADVTGIVASWCLDRHADACVWTALLPNFREELGREFSPDHAMRYLERLGPKARDIALRYIRSAPVEVDTPVRRMVSARWPVTVG
jgi:hypothetical protein